MQLSSSSSALSFSYYFFQCWKEAPLYFRFLFTFRFSFFPVCMCEYRCSDFFWLPTTRHFITFHFSFSLPLPLSFKVKRQNTCTLKYKLTSISKTCTRTSNSKWNMQIKSVNAIKWYKVFDFIAQCRVLFFVSIWKRKKKKKKNRQKINGFFLWTSKRELKNDQTEMWVRKRMVYGLFAR